MTLSSNKRRAIKKITDSVGEGGSSVFKIIAGAGVGKSVLITEIARNAADRSILFLSSSRNIVDRASISLPSNVAAGTLHSHALSRISSQYREKINAYGKKFSSTLSEQALISNGYVKTQPEAAAARAAFDSWVYSTRELPDRHDIPHSLAMELSAASLSVAITAARNVATEMADPRSTMTQLTYSFVIRLWATQAATFGDDLSPGIRASSRNSAANPRVDIVVIEEAQDCPDIVYDHFNRQNTTILMLGDPYQTFRLSHYNATGAASLGAFSTETNLSGRVEVIRLTETYRFGRPVASLLNALTHHIAGDADAHRLSAKGSSSIYGASRRGYLESQGVHYTFIARSVVTLLEESVYLARRGAHIAWVDGIASYNIGLFRDLVAIAMQEAGYPLDSCRAHDSRLSGLRSLTEAGQYFARAAHPDIYHLVALAGRLQTHGFNYLPIIDELIVSDSKRQQSMREDWSVPPHRHVTLVTSARSKGSEFDRVVIADDLAPLSLLNSSGALMAKAGYRVGFNHLYTALSRTKYELIIPESLAQWVSSMGFGTQLPPLDKNQLDSCDIRTSPLWHKEFGPSPQLLLEMDPDSRRKRKSASRECDFRPVFRESFAGGVKQMFEEELLSHQQQLARGPEALRKALRS